MACVTVGCGGGDAPAITQPGPDYVASVEAYRQELETRLTSDTGWLTIAGLEFLTKPETTFGSSPTNDIVLPGATPPRVGTFVSHDGQVSVRLEPGVQVSLLDGAPFTGGPITSDGDQPPDRLVLGDVQVWVHESGERQAIRIRDKHNPLRQTFTGRTWFPVATGYRVDAAYEAYPSPKTISITNLLGDVDSMTAVGEAVFSLHGEPFRMVAVEDGEELWFIFKDRTSADSTYPAARFLYTPKPKDGRVVLDFNRAESPPCAFNPYATCPLPPPQNRMAVRVEAGERYQRH